MFHVHLSCFPGWMSRPYLSNLLFSYFTAAKRGVGGSKQVNFPKFL